MLRDFYLGMMKIHILYHASKEAVYGTWLMEELGRHGYQPGPGTLYPMLHGLEKEGLLMSNRKAVGGKVRRYYQITDKGKGALKETRAKVRELVREVLEIESGSGLLDAGKLED
jgi:DNA-binding PadR family transcriptional regulator